MKNSIIVVVLGLFAYCAGNNAPGSSKAHTQEDPNKVTNSISSTNGGTVAYNQEAILQIPPESLPEDDKISIERISEIPNGVSDGYKSFGQAYRFSPPGTQFSLSSPSTLTIKYDTAAVLAQNLDPSSIQLFYFDEELERFINVPTLVDTSRGTVTAPIEHFTVYLPLAKLAVSGNLNPNIAMQAPIPNIIRADAPIYMRATVTDNHVNGAIAGVKLYCRKLKPTPSTWQAFEMTPEIDNTGSTGGVGRYVTLLPAYTLRSSDLGSGNDFEYYAEAIDNFGVSTTTSVTSVNVTAFYVPGSLVATPASFNIASGFQRVLNFQAKDSASVTFTVIPETVSTNGIGQILNVNSSGVLFKATTAIPGVVQAKFGLFPVESATSAVTVFQGNLDRISILDSTGMPFSGTFQIKEGYEYEFDSKGNDAFGNTILILPQWNNTPNLGSISVGPLPSDGGAWLNTLDASGFGYVQAILGNKSAIQHIQILPRNWVQKGAALDDSVDHPEQSAITFVGSTPYVAWYQISGGLNTRVYVKHWQNGSWLPDGGMLNINSVLNVTSRPDIASNGSTPYVAWTETNGSNYMLYVKYLAGNSWSELSGNAVHLNVNASTNAYSPRLAFAGTTPYVTWHECNASPCQVYVKFWNVTTLTWNQLGGPLNINAFESAENPSITIVAGVPYVTWQETDGPNNRIFVAHWDQTIGLWKQDGADLSVYVSIGPSVGNPDIGSWKNIPYVTWQESNEIHVKHFNGTNWISDGGNLNVNALGRASNPRIAFSKIAPYVTWNEDTPSSVNQIYVKHLRNGTWYQDGASLNVNPALHGVFSAIAISGYTPWITWRETTSPTTSLYVRALE